MITIKEYADSRAVSYEAVRRQVRSFKKELKSHVTVKNNTQMLDEYACGFLDEHRRPKNIVQTYSSEDLKKQIEALKAELDMAKNKIIVLQDEKAKINDRNKVLELKNFESETLLRIATQTDKELDETKQYLAETRQDLAETRQKLDAKDNELSKFVPTLFGLYRKVKN